ncbi:MAG: iron-containing redox enzyme family protein [Candidatus Rokubacteria bacterium]|nr:iron-containing redox enzyme family protein [Candidatus Rokubacteria bacterium]
MSVEQFLERLEVEVASHPALHHPFLKRFAAGGLSRLQLWAFGLQHYQLVRVFTSYLEAVVKSIREPEVRDWLHRILEDEYARPRTHDRSHAALYRRFLRALDLGENDWERAESVPGTRAFIEHHLELTALRHPAVGLGAVGPGHEWAIPTMFAYLVDGLRKSGVEEAAIEYFTLHVAQDVEHGALMRAALARHAQTEENQARIREGGLASLDARARFWDGLKRVVFEDLSS